MFGPKAAKTEYAIGMLPRNRKEVFYDVIKLNWGRFLLYGCLVLLFALPVHLSAVLGDIYRADMSAMAESGAADQAAVMAVSAANTSALVEIPLYVIFAAGFSGIAHVIRQHGWEENVYFRYEYVKGVRQNAAQYAILGLLAGGVRFACIWFRNMLLVNSGDAYYYAGYIPTVWAAVFLIPPAAYLTVCITIYDVSFVQNVKTAFMLYFKNILKTIPMVILCGAVFILQCLPAFSMHLIGRLVSSLAVPFIALAWFLFAFDRLDECVNKKHYPDLVGRGLFTEETAEVIHAHI